ncbi:MAG: hypothetical protein MUE55_07280 [Thermoplasmata archaeon]|jgi:hypothetical protein|nr:hypothetical protein [Thermoplasmata archaeon]
MGPDAIEVMSEQEAEDYVLDLLRIRGPMTTMEIEEESAKGRRRCPDRTVIFLTKMKRKGMVHGEVSIERRGWLWSLP